MTSSVLMRPGAVHDPPGTPVSAGSLLLIEDNPIDAWRTITLVRSRVPDMPCRHVSTLAEATPELLDTADCVLLDLGLPDAQDQEGLREILHRAADVPVVVVTGRGDARQLGLECLRNGAQDYLTKEGLDAAGLERCIRYAIERKRFDEHLAAIAARGAQSGFLTSDEARIAGAAEAQVRAAAVAAADAAAQAVSATDLVAAQAAATDADGAAIDAALGAHDVVRAAVAAADAAIRSADLLAADAAASAAAAWKAAAVLSQQIEASSTDPNPPYRTTHLKAVQPEDTGQPER